MTCRLNQTFGFDTALTTATDAIDKLHTTAESHHRVMILEVMGRYAGWIALQSGLAGGADVILIPEIPYSIERVIDKIMDRQASGKKFSIVVAAEGARQVGGQMVVQRMVADSFEPVRLGGIGNVLVSQIEEGTGMEARVTVLGHLQRGGSPTAFDRVLSTRYGTGAVNLVMAVALVKWSACGHRRSSPLLWRRPWENSMVPIDGDLIRTARQVGISFGD